MQLLCSKLPTGFLCFSDQNHSSYSALEGPVVCHPPLSPLPTTCSLSDLSPTLPFVTLTGLFSPPRKYRVFSYVKAFALAIFLLVNFFPQMIGWFSLTSFQSLFKCQGDFSWPFTQNASSRSDLCTFQLPSSALFLSIFYSFCLSLQCLPFPI